MRVLITRSGPMPNSSARLQPPSTQSSWPSASQKCDKVPTKLPGTLQSRDLFGAEALAMV